MSSVRERWEAGRAAEVSYWRDWLYGRTDQPEERALRLSDHRPFPWWAKPLVPGDRKQVRVLDLGAGPVSAMGNFWEGREVVLVPVDPLAGAYNEIMEEFGITPPVRTIQGFGEELVERFGEGQFDFAYASHSLDRCIEPMTCIRQMLKVLKPGASLHMVHHANEAEQHHYTGMLQWNFSLREHRLMLWNHGKQFDVLESCEGLARHHLEGNRRQIHLTLTKA